MHNEDVNKIGVESTRIKSNNIQNGNIQNSNIQNSNILRIKTTNILSDGNNPVGFSGVKVSTNNTKKEDLKSKLRPRLGKLANSVSFVDYKDENYKDEHYKDQQHKDNHRKEESSEDKDLKINNENELLSADYNYRAGYNYWCELKKILSERLNPQVFSAYIETLKFIEIDIRTESNSSVAALIMGAPSAFVCRHVLENFQDQISHFFENKLGKKVSLKILVKKSNSTTSSKKPYVVVKTIDVNKKENSSEGSLSANFDSNLNSNLNENYTFDNFVVGNSNEFTHAAALQVSEKPGASYNPLFIYGGVGLGKTHLLHAIGNEVKKKNKSVLYMSSEAFTNDLIFSLRTGKMDSFKAKLRSIDLLLIDDIQFMAHKERTQEEFFHTFNALYNSKNQIVITSDTLPQEIPGIEERLRTRFAWGLTADLQVPDLETRAAIIKRKANSDNFDLDEQVALYLAEKISSNVRELEGALTRIQAVCSLRKEKASLSLAKETLDKILKTKIVKVSIKDIILAVSNHFGIKQSEILSKKRTRNLSFPRHIAMYLCRKHTTASYPEIGSEFGGRDHSSVIHAANVVGTKLSEDLELQNIIKSLEMLLFE